MSAEGHNSNQQLRSIVERIERLAEEIKGLQADQRDIYSEAKGGGYCPKTLRKVIALRKKDPEVRAEESALLDTYLHALGME